MINVNEFVFAKLSADATLSGMVGVRIYPRTMPKDNLVRPIVVFNRISSGKIDLKGIRNEYMQISVWGKTIDANETIMGVIMSLFNGLKEAPVKFCDVQAVNETFDQETHTFGNHVTVHIKMFDHNL